MVQCVSKIKRWYVMKNFSKEEFVTLDEFTKNEFKTMSEYLTTLTKTFADAGIKNLFTEKELKKLKRKD